MFVAELDHSEAAADAQRLAVTKVASSEARKGNGGRHLEGLAEAAELGQGAHVVD